MSKITAHRDGQTREFTPKQWDVMGIGHCGWSAVPDTPKEVVHTMTQTIERGPGSTMIVTTTEPLPAKPYKKRRK